MNNLTRHVEEKKSFEELLARLLWIQLKASGIPETGGPRESLQAAVGARGVLRLWLDESLDILAERGLLTNENEHFRPTTSARNERDAWQEFEQRRHTWNQSGAVAPVLELVETAVRAIPDVLSGRRRATEVLFPGGSLTLAATSYQANPLADHFNGIVAATAAAIVKARTSLDPAASIRIIEIGAGTGGTTSIVLPRLDEFRARIKEYCYTDISRAFLTHGTSTYGERYPFLETRLFNVEKPVSEQDIPVGQYDFAIATNVLHATKDIRRTLRTVKAVLRTNGLLILNELVRHSFATHLTFGLLDGWWLHEDTHLRLRGSPILTPENWRRVLEAEGFNGVMHPEKADPALEQLVIVAESDGLVRLRNNTAIAASTESKATPAPERKREPRVVPFTPRAKQPPSVAEATSDLQPRLRGFLTNLFGKVLGVAPAEIDPTTPVETYGVDSILTVQLTGELGQAFEAVSVATIFEHNTIASLAEHLLRTQPDKVHEALGVNSVNRAEIRKTGSGGAALRPAAIYSAQRSAPAPRAFAAPGATTSVAIVGLAGRYPGGETLRDFWTVLREGRSAIREVPADRWDWRQNYDEERGKHGLSYARHGGFLDAIDAFDPLFFRLSPRDAESMDPQERLFLETAYACIEDAGYAPRGLDSERSVGVFVGVTNSYYPNGAYYWSIANRVSYVLDFTGPSFSVDTACSSSLTAIHLAVESIRNGSCACAIAGGVNLIYDRKHYVMLSGATMLSSGDKLRAFGAGADGFVDGEGVGAVLMKPLSRAVADGDRIYGVIRGTSINHGGKTNGYMVPNPQAQGRVIERSLRSAGVDARQVSYIEAHGTGTAIGDPIEIAGLSRAFSAFTEDRGFCAIGSAKSNIGHCESAAGIAGLTKVLLQMQHGELAPSLHAETLNPHINFEATPFVVQRELAPWRRPKSPDGTRELPRIAGVSSFGGGGANAHIVIEEYVAPAVPHPVAEAGPQILVLSARTEDRLRARAEDLVAAMASQDLETASLADIAYTLQVGREALEVRLALTAATVQEARSRIEAWLAGENHLPNLWHGGKRERAGTLSLLGEDDLSGVVERWLTHGQFDRIAEAWTKGIVIDWPSLHANAKRKRVQLPTYPFERTRYWIRESVEAVDSRPAPRLVEQPIRALPSRLTTNAAPPEPSIDLGDRLEAAIREAAATVIKIPPQDLSIDADLMDFGFDSITLAQLANHLNEALALDLTASDFFEARNLRAIARSLIASKRDAVAAAFAFGQPKPRANQHRSEPSPRREATASSSPDLGEQLKAMLREAAADVMKMRPQDLPLDDELANYGFDSITLAQLANRLNQTLDLDLTASDFFEARTLASLAETLVAGRREAVAAAFGDGRSNEVRPVAPLRSDASCSGASLAIPLSHQQRTLWCEENEDIGAAYHLPVVLRLTGHANAEVLKSAVAKLISRHEALRSRITSDGDEMVQTIDPPGAVPFAVHDIAGATLSDKLAAARRLQRDIIAAPFNLANDLPIRVALLRIADEDNFLVVVVHHIVSDGISMDILTRELAEIYSAEMEHREDTLVELKATYADYVAQQSTIAQANDQSSLEYWRETLRGAPVETSLPFDRARPQHRSHSGDTVPLEIPPGLTSNLREVAKSTGTTPFMVLAAGLKTLIARLSNQEDVVIGTASAARRRADFEPLIGFFANTIALRTDLSGEPSFLALLQRVKQSSIDAYAHDRLRFERILEAIAPPRHPARHPFFQIMITLRKKDTGEGLSFGQELTAYHEQPEMLQTPFDVMLQFLEGPSDLSASVEFASDLFDRNTIERYMACYLALLEAALDNPQTSIWMLPLLKPGNHADMLSVCEGDSIALPSATGIHRLVARQARATPDATAVVFQGCSLSYRELDRMANKLAHHLQAVGVERRSIVAVGLGPTEMVVVSLLAILKAGAAYLPLDPTDPPAGLQHMLDDSEASHIIIQRELAAGLNVGNLNVVRLDAVADAVSSCPETPPDVISQADDPIKVIYDHGSTASPKGVMVSHGAFLNSLVGMTKRMPVGVGDVCAPVVRSPLDIAGTEFWLPLTTGATLAVIDSATMSSGEDLRRQLVECGATLVHASPTIWRKLIETEGQLPPGLTAITCGESLPEDLAAALSERVGKLWFLYGPTETTVCAAGMLVSPEWRVGCVGKPFENTKFYVVDRQLQLVPRGVPGEICLAGAGLALGYKGQPALTGERFPHDPSGPPGTRLFRTGDLGRICRDGTIDLLGRRGHQFKLRSHDVDPGDTAATPITEEIAPSSRAPRSVLLQAGSTPPLFLFPALGGGAQIYGDLVRSMASDQKCIGLNGLRETPTTLEALAAQHAEEVIRLAPDGELRLAGWSFGGLVALEAARVLIGEGMNVRTLALFDSNLRNKADAHSNPITECEIWAAFAYALRAEQCRSDLDSIDTAPVPGDFQALSVALDEAVMPQQLEQLHAVFARNMRAWAVYRPEPLDVDTTIFKVATSSPISRGLVDWSALLRVTSVTTLPGDHFSILRRPHVATLGEHLKRELYSGKPSDER
jgi:amino acid adenylation domain-containing protein